MKLTFLQSNKPNWGNLQIELSDAISQFLKCGKDFEIEFLEVKASKSYEQLKGIHKLCQLLAVRLSEINGLKYSMENAKDWVKWQFGFTREATEEEAMAEAINERNKAKLNREQFMALVESFKANLRKPRSFATATKEEMIELIEKIHALAAKMGWEEVRLTSVEMGEMVKYYQQKE